MKVQKRFVTRFLFGAEIMVFSWFYFCGTQGLRVIWQQEQENNIQQLNLNKLQADVACLERDLHAWHNNSFYKEKIAREQLQMAREGDTIYYLT